MASDEPYGNDVRELSLYDAGISSLSELSELPRMTQLHSLNLHCNRIKAIACVEPLTQLKYLNLSSNLIETMGGLHTLARLQTLDLSCNRIRLIDGLATLRSLKRLQLSFNRISSLAGLVQCHGGDLAHFEAYGNRITLLREAEYFRGLPKLAEVVLVRHGQDNPICREDGYRERLLNLLPHLQVLDDVITPIGKDAADAQHRPPLASAVAGQLNGHEVLAAAAGAAAAGASAAVGSLQSHIDNVASMAAAAAASGRGDRATTAPRAGAALAAGQVEPRDAGAAGAASTRSGKAAVAAASLPDTPHVDSALAALQNGDKQIGNTYRASITPSFFQSPCSLMTPKSGTKYGLLPRLDSVWW